MRRGTTPTHTIDTSIDLTEAAVIYVTYKQKGRVIVEKSDPEVTSEAVTVSLTQQETLALCASQQVHVQIRARFPDGTAVASNIMVANVDNILKEGVI